MNVYGEKLKNKLIQKWWIYYESRRQYVSALMNLHQDLKMVKQVLIEQRWTFNKIQKQKESICKQKIL